MFQRPKQRAPAWTGHGLLATVLCAFLLVLPALLNRAPFVYFDTGAYLGRGDQAARLLGRMLNLAETGEAGASPSLDASGDDTVLAGRSIYYGFLAWSGTETLGLVSVALLQALVLAALVVTAVRTARPDAPPATWVAAATAIAAGLALLTSAGFFVSLVMPDVWAGIMVLAFALLMAREATPSGMARAALGTIMALAALFHTSHLLLLGSLTGLLALAWLRPRWRRRLPPGRLVVPAAALACGLAGQLAFSAAVTALAGRPPLAMPHMTAHLVDMGPGTRLAQDTCPGSGFALCAYVDRLPTDWTEFLFSRDPQTAVFRAAPPEVQRALSEEQARFALATLAAEPLATLGGLARDGVAQLWHLSVDDVPLTAANEQVLALNFSPEVAEEVRGSTIWSRPWIAPTLSWLIEVGAALAAAGLLVLALAGRLPRHGPVATLLLVCLVGLVLNALICGVLASPYGRFQARITWLLPLMLALAALPTRAPKSLPFEGGARDAA